MKGQRGFEKVSSYKDDIKLPMRGTKQSAGYDFFLLEDVSINPGEIKKIKTGIKSYMGRDEFLGIYVRSSVGLRGIALRNTIGIIDADYYNNDSNEGEIMVVVENIGDDVLEFPRGDRLVQGIYQRYYRVDGDHVSETRDGGFGSTSE